METNSAVEKVKKCVTDGLNNELLVCFSDHGLNNKLLVRYSGHVLNNELLAGI